MYKRIIWDLKMQFRFKESEVGTKTLILNKLPDDPDASGQGAI